ncbi:LLM class flavin-dependent oxidoreductase [Jatrophihabitans lederbergiae]|uniref:LLM class flavin-dependent oxidoreductase n=1 Tax=Jatrophihabitans lederbergiae TaxID=3075547 RepID=A0ABU2JFS2_9ACTN|nr:LLM class flavin-dependent oxidoreductase [Jatrophihabitans sp. DSM 44399]MDT0263831.1 LLM class flavin-dependent oxidoreductase [Jatrophihabitans sp. DSM 44399]
MSLKFGAFIPPFHALGEDPSAAIRRDLRLIEWLDELGFAEAWVGEHHSGGWAPVSSPEVLLAAAVERTRRIMLGTGVVSLPYHHPMMVASRLVQLDQQSRGRIMMGAGAGVSPADASMFGIAATDQRRMMIESLEAIVELLTSDEPVNRKTDWFELNDARLAVRPYQRPRFDIAVASAGSERGMRLAARYGLSPLNFAGRPGMVEPPLSALWAAGQDEAAKLGTSVDRASWRVAICTHVAETREKAFEQVRGGMGAWFRDYVIGTMGASATLPEGREVEAAVEAGTALIGSPDDVIEGIERLLDESGGFGTLLVNVQDWASPHQVRDSFELMARFVVPHFSGSTDSLRRSQAWVAERRSDFAAQGREAAQLASSS